MLLTLYKGLSKNATPLLERYLRRREKAGKEDPARAGERRGVASIPRGAKPLVWFHAASVGEAQSLLALIDRTLGDFPRLQALVTTGTVTSAKLMTERLPLIKNGGGAFHQYLPVDQPDWTEKFLTHWKPDLVIWSESEFWPNVLAGVKARGIPAVLLNARLSEKSFRRWKFAHGLIRTVLSTFSLCLGQNEAEVARLKALGAADAQIAGNLKYAALPLPCDAAELEKLRGMIGSRPRVLWASTHPGEEEQAFRLHQYLKETTPDLLTIIAPRHPSRGDDVAILATQEGLHAARRSLSQAPRKGDDVYIADTLGELGLLFRLAPLCIMGGSFVPHGGHNPIEPAQLGCVVFYGPHMFNFVSICHDFESRNAARRIADAYMLERDVERALKNPADFTAMAAAAKEWTEQQSRVVEETMAHLKPLLQKVAA